MPKISIIVPVYKVEKYICRCLDSIVAQTFTDWECLLVDDGSPDNSGKICDEYAEKDSRFRVFHKENGGVSSARNLGLDNAKGEWIIHVDSDDWIEKNMLSELFRKATDDNADMVICDFFQDTHRGCQYVNQKIINCNDNALIIRQLFDNLMGSTWNKLIKRDCYLKFDIHFPYNFNYCEDKITIIRLLKYSISVVYLNKAFYHYDMSNSQSITRNVSRKTIEDEVKFVNSLISIISENSFEVREAKQMVKLDAFRFKIFNNIEMKNLYPEIKTYNKTNFIYRICYMLAFAGHQGIAHFFISFVDFFYSPIRKLKKYN